MTRSRKSSKEAGTAHETLPIPCRANVVDVRAGRGSLRPGPPLDPKWDRLTKLEWLAGVVAHRTSLDVRVDNMSYERRLFGWWYRPRNVFAVHVGLSANLGLTFTEAWYLLVGIEQGAEGTCFAIDG